MAELGYDITVQDLEMMVADLQELDEEELAAVAGGNVINGEGLPVFDGDNDRDGREAWCVAYWHCYTALMHTEGAPPTRSASRTTRASSPTTSDAPLRSCALGPSAAT